MELENFLIKSVSDSAKRSIFSKSFAGANFLKLFTKLSFAVEIFFVVLLLSPYKSVNCVAPIAIER